MFIDEAKITVKAGDGGHGCIAFRREKFVPRGGPSGGDGGNGGNIYLATDTHENTLLKFRYNHTFRAERGRHGEGSNRHGRNGEDLEIKIPVGTVVYDDRDRRVVSRFHSAAERVLIAKGGRGGHGNAHFASSVNRAPQQSAGWRARRRESASARIEAACRCGTCRLSQRRQIDIDFTHLRSASENCGLSVYHAGASAWRRFHG